MSNFKAFKDAVAGQFAIMQQHPLYRANVDKDKLWEAYLMNFPSGTNEVYRVRAEHDCSCCKNFVRSVGDVVAVIGGRIVSIWDAAVPGEAHYEHVSRALSAMVRNAPIKDKFLHYERSAGQDKSFEQLTEVGGVPRPQNADIKTWEHFFVNIAPVHLAKKDDIPTLLAKERESKNVLLRALTEIDAGTVDTVLELVAQGSLYRGDEHLFALNAFRELQKKFVATAAYDRDTFAWEVADTRVVPESVSRIRNTAIGTLLVDLAKGEDMESAVKSFEAKVAPANYRRPTSLVTKAMVDKARKDVEALGLTSALSRRHATKNDITVNNILFVDRSGAISAAPDAFGDLHVEDARKLGRVEEVNIEKFLADVLPGARSVEVLLENRHAPNLVSLIAPDDPTAGRMFKWDNLFSWSYNGEMADSIRERVKAAGGSVTGDLCCRLAWDYADDLDFHMLEPGKYSIFFPNKRRLSPCGGMLDLDANGGDGQRPDPAENIFYADRRKMAEGVYTLSVNNFARRSNGRGFTVEIEFDGQTHSIAHDKVLRTGDTTIVAKIKYDRKEGFSIVESLPGSQASKELWGLRTQAYHPVSMVMLSPNRWDDGPVGNKHYMFMVDGCVNGGEARGFFNEFLRQDLDKHRKVLEMVGGKLKVAGPEGQLSGLGFSSTARNSLVCRVRGSFTRVIKVAF